ncbi:hypothetical protein MKW92_042618 [Papaver armeniacum]|nr:hypothetical protein MKW92_042618 [Papaver armeniacum]
MEMELRKLENVVKSVHDEMIYLHERYTIHKIYFPMDRMNYFVLIFLEEEMQGINRAINSKMAWLGFLSLLVCL